MANNYTTSELSQVPYPENAQFQQIKGLTGSLVFLMVGFALMILKYIKMNASKILESKDVEKNVITELTKLHDRVELLSYRQKKTSFQPDYKKKYEFDPHICSSCKSEDECPHDVVDTRK